MYFVKRLDIKKWLWNEVRVYGWQMYRDSGPHTCLPSCHIWNIWLLRSRTRREKWLPVDDSGGGGDAGQREIPLMDPERLTDITINRHIDNFFSELYIRRWVWNRYLVRTCCRAQGTLLGALWWPGWEGHPKGRRYVYTCIQQGHFAVQQELAQHCKATIPQ